MIRSLGIDIGAKSIKIAEIHYSPGSRRIVDLVQIPFVATEGPWPQLKQFMLSRPKVEETVAMGLGKTPVVLKKFSFPFGDRLKVEAAIRSDFEDTLPVELANYELNFKLLTKVGKMNEFIAGLCHTEDLELLNKLFEDNSLHPDHLGVDSEALGQLALHQNLEAANSNEPYLIIDIGFSSSKLAFLRGHRGQEFFKDVKATPDTLTDIMELRTLSRGSSEIIEWMAERKNLSLADAEKWLHHRAEILMEDGGQSKAKAGELSLETSDEIKTALRPVIVEIYQTLQAFRGQHDVVPQTAYLTGGVTQLKGFREFLEHELRLKVVNWDIFKGFECSQVKLTPAHRNEFATALALAHRFVLSKSRGWLNFRKSQTLQKKLLSSSLEFLLRPDVRPLVGFVAGVWLFLVLYMMASQFLLGSQITEVRKALVTEFQKFDPELSRKAQRSVLELKKTEELFSVDVKRRLAKITGSGDSSRAKIEFLLDLSEALPSKAQVRVMQIESQGQSQKLISSVSLQEAFDDRQMKSLAESLENDFKERGYSSLDFEKISDRSFKLSAKWGGAPSGSN